MKILIARTFFPFEEELENTKVLKELLVREGHSVDTVRLPILRNSNDLLSQLISYRMHHIENECDLLICEDIFSGLLHHENKICVLYNSEIDKLKYNFLEYNEYNFFKKSILEYITRVIQSVFDETKVIFMESLYLKENICDDYNTGKCYVLESYENILSYISGEI